MDSFRVALWVLALLIARPLQAAPDEQPPVTPAEEPAEEEAAPEFSPSEELNKALLFYRSGDLEAVLLGERRGEL